MPGVGWAGFGARLQCRSTEPKEISFFISAAGMSLILFTSWLVGNPSKKGTKETFKIHGGDVGDQGHV